MPRTSWQTELRRLAQYENGYKNIVRTIPEDKLDSFLKSIHDIFFVGEGTSNYTELGEQLIDNSEFDELREAFSLIHEDTPAQEKKHYLSLILGNLDKLFYRYELTDKELNELEESINGTPVSAYNTNDDTIEDAEEDELPISGIKQTKKTAQQKPFENDDSFSELEDDEPELRQPDMDDSFEELPVITDPSANPIKNDYDEVINISAYQAENDRLYIDAIKKLTATPIFADTIAPDKSKHMDKAEKLQMEMMEKDGSRYRQSIGMMTDSAAPDFEKLSTALFRMDALYHQLYKDSNRLTDSREFKNMLGALKEAHEVSTALKAIAAEHGFSKDADSLPDPSHMEEAFRYLKEKNGYDLKKCGEMLQSAAGAAEIYIKEKNAANHYRASEKGNTRLLGALVMLDSLDSDRTRATYSNLKLKTPQGTEIGSVVTGNLSDLIKANENLSNIRSGRIAVTYEQLVKEAQKESAKASKIKDNKARQKSARMKERIKTSAEKETKEKSAKKELN